VSSSSLQLSLYADESGIHGDARECVLAGYIASRQQWQSFDREWQRALRQLSAPIKEFHAKFFFPRQGDYRFLADPEQEGRKLLDRLLAIIKGHDLHAFGVGVDIAAFNALTWGERAWLTGATLKRGTMSGGAPSKPYYLCFMHSIFEAEGVAKDGDTVDFFFARQEQFKGLAAQHFEVARKHLDVERSRKIGTLEFPSAADESALQAADLLSHCCHSRFAARESMSPEKHYALRGCERNLEFKGWSANTFEALFSAKFSSVDRERLRSTEPPQSGKPARQIEQP